MIDYKIINKNTKLYLGYDCILPTTRLPNALNIEYALIDFLASFHTTNFRDGTVLQYNPNVLSTLFGKSFSYMETSQTDNILGDWEVCYNANIEHMSVYELMRGNHKFIYPIAPIASLDLFMGIGTSNSEYSKAEGNYFWKNISNISLEYIRNGDAIIVIDYTSEGVINRETFEQIHIMLELAKIPKENIFLCVGCYNAQELYNKWFPKEKQYLTVRSWPIFPERVSVFYHRGERWNAPNKQCVNLNTFLELKSTIRNKHCCFRVNSLREHRLFLMYSALLDGLLDVCDYSLLGGRLSETNDFHFQVISDLEHLNLEIRHFERKFNVNYSDNDIIKINEFRKGAPYRLQNESSITRVGFGMDKAENWTTSYFSACTETHYDTEYIVTTEKVYLTLLNFHPFVFFGIKGGLKLLKESGFKTFEGFIDESYDDVDDPIERMKLAYIQLKRLCSMTKEEIHNWYWSMEDILIHNHTHLTEYFKDHTALADDFMELTNRLNNKNHILT